MPGGSGIVLTKQRGETSETSICSLQALEAYPKEKLTKIWDKKMAILKKIIAAKGGNKYDIHGDK